jgi:hypothetical protein
MSSCSSDQELNFQEITTAQQNFDNIDDINVRAGGEIVGEENILNLIKQFSGETKVTKSSFGSLKQPTISV